MAKAKFDSFRGLLRGAICDVTQAEFAAESGISAEHLNRMLNSREINRPSATTLHKIAAVARNGITFQDLKNSLDREDPDYKEETVFDLKCQEAFDEFEPTFGEKAYDTFGSVKEATVEVMEKSKFMCSDLNDYMEAVTKSYKRLRKHNIDVLYDLGEQREYFGSLHPDVTHWMRVQLSIADGKSVAQSNIILYFSALPKADLKVLQYAEMQGKYITELYGYSAQHMEYYHAQDMDDEETCAAIDDEPYLIWVNNPVEKELTEAGAERLLNILFGARMTEHVVEGFGFELDECPAGFANFCKIHQKAILNAYKNDVNEYVSIKEKLDKLIQDGAGNDEFMELLDRHRDSMNGTMSWKSVISRVMYLETGCEFQYYKADEPSSEFPNLSTTDCIMVSDDYFCANPITYHTLVAVTAKYVKELRLEVFGDIEFHTLYPEDSKGTLARYRVKYDDDGVDFESEIEIDWCHCDDKVPAESGPYWVLLKDGRQMPMLFFVGGENSGRWVARHREWSYLVDAWDSSGPIRRPRPISSTYRKEFVRLDGNTLDD